jgi:hypothetical protein
VVRRRSSRPAPTLPQSYGGSVITGAGTDDRVAGLIYIAALAPDADETHWESQERDFEMIKTIEIERFSLTSSQPFDQVVTALNTG